jgi:hypothetical protein
VFQSGLDLNVESQTWGFLGGNPQKSLCTKASSYSRNSCCTCRCKVNGINSYRYLQALLVALPLAQTADDYEALLPWNIALTSE